MNKTIEQIKNGQMQIRIPNLDTMYEDVVAFVKANQGEKGYIDTQSDENDTIYGFEYNYEYQQGEERVVHGVRVDEDGDLQVVLEPIMRTYKVTYDDDAFRGVAEEGNAQWESVKWSDVYYVPTLFNIAENIEEYA